MSSQSFLPLLRELARCYQSFELTSSRHIRELGLTPPQFDIIATLGNTAGMSCKELGEKTLITKGTLTGVLDRLAERDLISRSVPPEDRRSIFICLTPAGGQAACTAYVGDKNVGDTWTQTASDGSQITVTLQAGR